MKENKKNKLYKWLPWCLEGTLLLMMIIIAVRFASYTAVTKLGVSNQTIVSWSKGIDLSTTVSVEEISSESNPIYRFKKKVFKYTQMIESLCTASFPISRGVNKAVTWINKAVFHNNLSNNPGVYGVSKPAGEAAENIIEFMNYLEEKEIPHVYVHTPYIESYKNFIGQTELIERWDTVNGRERFLSVLDESGTEYIDVYRDKGDYELTFDSSSHWQSADALFATKLTADYLNKKYNLNLNTNILNLDDYVDITSQDEDFQKAVRDREGFEWQYLIPKEEGSYSITRDDNTVSGDFITCFINPVSEWRESEEVYHNICGLNNGTPYYITNNSLSDGSKCLIIGDSFAWPVYSYMAREFNYETAIWNFTEGFSYYEYIDTWKPDAVIVILNDCQLSGEYHFDFNG